LIVLFFDYLLRLYKFSIPIDVISTTVHDDQISILKLDKKFFHYGPAQFAFLWIPQISLIESHPFTISSHSSSKYVSFHIKGIYFF
jgi:predicted ferric reductase